MATTRSNSVLTRQNSRAVRDFTSAVAGTMVSFSRNTIQQAGRIGLQKLVNQAGFNDYTGKLINSYQAAILTKGGIEERIGRAKKTTSNEYGINATGRNAIMMTSYGMPGTIPISHDRATGGFRMRRRRDGGESPEIRKGHMVSGKLEKSFGKGYGDIITRIQGIAPPIQSGYWLVFDNGASNVTNKDDIVSVAERVHTNGPVQHRVFPDRLNVDVFGIGQKELKRSIAAYKRYNKH